MAASRQIGQVRASVFVGMLTAATGQPPLASTMSSAPCASATAWTAGNHWAAWESP